MSAYAGMTKTEFREVPFMLTEFQLIEKFFTKQAGKRRDVALGIGDDAALLKVPPKQLLVTSVDTLVAGVHFPLETSPKDIGYKSLAVNLSDLAAMGAEPAWVSLALTLPEADEKWLKPFSQGFFSLVKKFNLQLIGGDTTRGPLTITVQVFGFLPLHQALRRSTAKAGDLIYVTGTLGDAGLALQALQKQNRFEMDEKDFALILKKLNRPQPRVVEGLFLRHIASSAIDISDGLAADLQHILTASNVGATIYVDDLPLSKTLRKNMSLPEAQRLALTAGDDYELCFTVSPKRKNKLENIFNKMSCSVTCVGVIEPKKRLRLKTREGKAFEITQEGYQHFINFVMPAQAGI